MDNEVTRYIQYIEVSNGDACIVLDDGSVLGGVFSVSAASTAGSNSYAVINAYIVNEETNLLDDLIKKHKDNGKK
jgi:hypothetical protein